MTAQDTRTRAGYDYSGPPPAADAFDLPAALAARERRAPESSRLGGGAPSADAHVAAESLPQGYVPRPDR